MEFALIMVCAFILLIAPPVIIADNLSRKRHKTKKHLEKSEIKHFQVTNEKVYTNVEKPFVSGYESFKFNTSHIDSSNPYVPGTIRYQAWQQERNGVTKK